MRNIQSACVLAAAALLSSCGPQLPDCGTKESTSLADSIVKKIMTEQLQLAGKTATTLPSARFDLVTTEGKDTSIGKLSCAGTYIQPFPDALTAALAKRDPGAKAELKSVLTAFSGGGQAKVSDDSVSFPLEWTIQLSGDQLVGKLQLAPADAATLAMLHVVVAEVHALPAGAPSTSRPNAGAAPVAYAGVGDGNVELKLAPSGQDVQVSLTTSMENGCSGGLDAIGVRKGSTITVNHKEAGNDEACSVKIQLEDNDRVAVIEEGAGCVTYHGASCGFSAKTTRTK